MFKFTVHNYLLVIFILIIGIKLVGAPARFACQLDSPTCGLFPSSCPFTTSATLCTPHLLPLFPQTMLEFIKLMFYYTEGKSLNFTSKCNQNELLQLLCLCMRREGLFLFLAEMHCSLLTTKENPSFLLITPNPWALYIYNL